MNTFKEQLELVHTHLGRLNALVLACPDLFEHGYGIGIDANRVWVYLHASIAPHDFDWRAFALRYKAAGWKRERGYDGFDWRGKLNGVELVIIGAERLHEPETLFAEAQAEHPAELEATA